MTLPLRKLLPWLVFALCLTAVVALGNHAVQMAAIRECNAEYTEYHLNYLEKEVARLRAQNHKLQQELDDSRIDG
jgi:hypothetical protein